MYPLEVCKIDNLFGYALTGIMPLQMALFEMCLEIETRQNLLKDLPLEHEHSRPQQESGTIDCPIFIVCYMEQILREEELNITQTDVSYLWLHYITRILVGGMYRRGGPLIMKADGTEDSATKDDDGNDRAE